MKSVLFGVVAVTTLTLTLAGCITSPKPVVGPDGTPNQLLSCTAIEDCYSQARKICNGNYKIVNTSNENLGGDSPSINNLLVKCEK